MRYLAISTATLLLGLLAGCASEEYTYVPEQNYAVTVSPKAATELSYPIYSGPKLGSVAVTFVGLKDLEVKKGEPKVRAAQVRLDVRNDSEHDWTVDTQRVQLEIPGYGKDKAEFIATKEGTAPTVDVRAKAQKVVDFYFPLPEDMKKAKELPAFSLAWEVKAPDRTIAQTTKFARVPIEQVSAEPAYPANPYGYGAGAYGYSNWWYDPFWAPYPYYGAVPSGRVGVGVGASGGRMMPPKR